VAKDQTGRLRYGFEDLVAVRAANTLLKNGARHQRVRQAVDAIRTWKPDALQPLAAVKLEGEDEQVLVVLDGRTIDPRSGQLVFRMNAEESKRLGQVIHHPATEEEAGEAETQACFSDGIAAENSGNFEGAERAYRRTLTLEPTHPWALINLGNLIFRRGNFRTASELYRTATRAAPYLAAAWYNLANALDELEQSDAAVTAYRETLSLEPEYADAHFNLALLWEKMGKRLYAEPHWKNYLRLAPEHPSAETARAFLQSTD